MQLVIPAGTYVLGDPCYTIKDEDWDTVLEKTDYFTYPDCELHGKLVIGFHTAYGDGDYKANNGRSYGVDAGLIGLVQVNPDYEIPEHYKDTVSLVTFPEPCIALNREGYMRFGAIRIDTR